MARRDKASDRSTEESVERHLIGTMFDPSILVERTLSTGTTVRLRVRKLDQGTVMVYEAKRRRPNGEWTRWSEFEGEQSAEALALDRCTVVDEG